MTRRDRPITPAETARLERAAADLAAALKAAQDAPTPARRGDALRRALSAARRGEAAIDPAKAGPRQLLERYTAHREDRPA